jgi:hypothetical protein
MIRRDKEFVTFAVLNYKRMEGKLSESGERLRMGKVFN